MERKETPNQGKGRKGNKVTAIVLHMTESSSKSAIDWFSRPQSQVSSHYLVGEEGEVYQFVNEEDTAWHAGTIINPTWKGLIKGVNPNLHTIGIETALVNETQIPSWKQWTSLVRLVKDIKSRHGDLELVNHKEINGAKKCPGWYANKLYVTLLSKVIN